MTDGARRVALAALALFCAAPSAPPAAHIHSYTRKTSDNTLCNGCVCVTYACAWLECDCGATSGRSCETTDHDRCK